MRKSRFTEAQIIGMIKKQVECPTEWSSVNVSAWSTSGLLVLT